MKKKGRERDGFGSEKCDDDWEEVGGKKNKWNWI